VRPTANARRREARERDEEARRRQAEERLRIARELHDTLAHSLVAINVRAGVALDLPDSEDASAALEDVKQASATALRDLRATLSLLRAQGEIAPTTPAVDLEALPGLLDQARSAGLRTDLDLQINGCPRGVGGGRSGLSDCAGGLANVLRHANASSAHVAIRTTAKSLDVEITDDGRSGEPGASPGLGLRGMAERATALGGRINAGPTATGGWCVHAVLPLNGSEPR